MSAEITKENLPEILKDLGKEYRKKNGKSMQVEIIMTVGAAILARYGFRDSSYDIDAIIRASSSLKDAALTVGEKYGLEHNWLNSDFKDTGSYSEKLYQHSQHYRTFANVLHVRTVKPEYLAATKLRSARPYKHDLSDIVGIITEERAKDPKFSKQKILEAYRDMYGDAKVDQDAKSYMDLAFSTEDPEGFIRQIREKEADANHLLRNFQKSYPDTLNNDNINDILQSLKDKRIDR